METPEHLTRPSNPRKLTAQQLYEEWQYWNWKINISTRWGAAVAVAAGFRQECKQELLRRGCL